MSCHFINQVLNDRDPTKLSAAERIAVDGHLISCRSCASVWHAQKELVARPIPKTPDDLLLRISGAIDDSLNKPAAVSRSRTSLMVAGLLTLGVAAATVVWQIGQTVSTSTVRNEVPTSASPEAEKSYSGAEPDEQEKTIDGVIELQNEPDRSSIPSQEMYPLDARTIVVLPFENRATSPDFAGLSEDISKKILYQLGLIKDLNVISEHRVATYVESKAPEEEIARLFGAGSILVGTITETESDLEIIVTVVDAQSGKTRFGSGSVINKRGKAPDLSELEDIASNIAVRIAESLVNEQEVRPSRQQSILEQRAMFLDTSRSDSERMQSLGRLRYPDAKALSGTVAAAAVEMAMNSTDISLRRQVWEYLKGAHDPYLVQPLLTTLAYDSSEHVRSQAVKTLQDFIDEPDVREALQYASVHDKSQSVRDQVRFTLATEQEQQEMIAEIVLNTALSDRNRLAPIREAFSSVDRVDNAIVITDAMVGAMIEMAENSNDPRTRGSIWMHLRGVDNPDLVRPLLEHLLNDPVESVRIFAATLLGEYLDHGGVRAALENAKANDVSRSVRRAARSSLDQVDQ